MDDVHDPANWPRWAFVVSALLVAALAVLMVAVATRPLVVAGLVLVMLVPWVDHVLGKHPPVWVFLSLAITPLLALNTVLLEAAGTDTAIVSAMLVIFIQGESVSAYPRHKAVLGVAAGMVVLFAHVVRVGDLATVYLVAGSAIAMTVGYLIRRQQETLVELRRAQERLVGEATLFERQRIAREVHDVIAHSMTVVMMHLTAARMAVARDPQAATEALEEAERLGRSSLAEIRRTVGVLRAEADRATDRALPTGADVDELVEDFRAAGLTVDLHVTGRLDGVDGTAGLTLYRVVQESLANAARHAPGAPVQVDVSVGADVEACITNPVPAGVRAGASSGHGLAGMAERAQVLGGTVTAGPHGPAWRVECRLPLATTEEGCRW